MTALGFKFACLFPRETLLKNYPEFFKGKTKYISSTIKNGLIDFPFL